MPQGPIPVSDHTRVRIRCVILGLCLAAACGKQLGPGKTPKETVRNLEVALQALELGAVYDMMSGEARRRVDRSVRVMRNMLAAFPEEQLEKGGLDGLKDMTTREFLEASIERAKEEGNLRARFETVTIAIMKVKTYGERASVKVTMIINGRDQAQTIPMVREGGRWHIDSDDVVASLQVDLTPDTSSCVTLFT